MKDFNQLLGIYEGTIKKICHAFANNYRKWKFEEEDLIQVAHIKLWELSENKNFNINNTKQVKEAIKNCLLNHIRDEATVQVNNHRVLKPLYKATNKGLMENEI